MRTVRALGCSLLLALAACATARVEPHEAGADESSQLVRVEVINRAFAESVVYLQAAGGRQRLGTARGMSTTSFDVVWNVLLDNNRDAQLMAEPIGTHQSLRGSTFRLQPGQHVVWTIQWRKDTAPSELGLQLY